jgi:hypothetical protein
MFEFDINFTESNILNTCISVVYIYKYIHTKCMLSYSANGYSFINLNISLSVIYNVAQMAITLSSLKVLTALGKLACKGHLHNQLYRYMYMYVFYNNANGNEVFDCAYMQSTLLWCKWHLQCICLEVHMASIL